MLYNILIYTAYSLAKIAALFNPKVKKFIEGRQRVNTNQSGNRVACEDTGTDRFKIWFHASSVGEFEQGRPVIELFRKNHPEYQTLLTFFSPSGYELHKNFAGVDAVSYLPIDTPAEVRRFVAEIRPTIVCFIKYEFWYNVLKELNRQQIPVVLFSAIFRPNQAFFKWYGGFFREMLFCFDAILVQNEYSQKLLKSIDYQSVTIAGDTRIDRVANIAAQAKPIEQIEIFKNNEPLLVVGSVWPDDMDVLIPFINNFVKPLKIIIAPHEIDNKQIENWQSKIKKTSLKWSEITSNNQLKTAATVQPEVLFLDTIGLLSTVYQYGGFAYIGGAFGDGLHNILEPAAFGMSVFFGNKFYDKFQESHDLIALGAAHTVGDTDELHQIFSKIYENKPQQHQAKEVCRKYISTQQGANQIVLDEIDRFLT